MRGREDHRRRETAGARRTGHSKRFSPLLDARGRSFVKSGRLAPDEILDDQEIAGLELAVNEAASNIMKHAYHGRRDQRIQLDGDAYPDRIAMPPAIIWGTRSSSTRRLPRRSTAPANPVSASIS